MILATGETIVTAWAERCSGPGWTNYPIWVLVCESSGNHRVECIQPDQQTDAMLTLFKVSEAAHRAMTGAVRATVSRQ